MIVREFETHVMKKLLDSDKAELLAISGRRRVGKTYLIKHVYAGNMVFDFTGTQYAEKENQLEKFATKLTEYSKAKITSQTPASWAAAFTQLKQYLLSLPKTKQNKVVFFDELPWIAAHRSGFLQEFSYWWNDWASTQKLVVVICGSAASWMIQKVINHKGGLHNRVTKRIHLLPFTLQETKEYLLSKKINLQHYEIIQIYMALGGVPHYLNEIVPGESAIQTINRLCLAKSGSLRQEFGNLYAALFDHPENHIAVIKALSQKHSGMTRQEIIAATKFTDGGGLSKVLDELETSNFIMQMLPFGKIKKDTVYRMADEYSLFYIKFIEGQRAGANTAVFTNIADEKYKIWRCYAFENICIKHADAIKQALGISGINTFINSFAQKAYKNNSGLQIDMLIDRADNTINICEIKFYNDTIEPNAEMADTLRKRRELFRRLSGTKKQLFNTIISTYGVSKNEYTLSQVDSSVTMDALFSLQRFVV
jgi:uncharacterized protein